jgi:hypothetical protein
MTLPESAGCAGLRYLVRRLENVPEAARKTAGFFFFELQLRQR